MRIVEFDLGFEPHDKLNPALWQGEDLLPDVKSALVKIAEDFKKYIDIPFDVEDLVITGGQVSYYYTKHSDLDLHLVVDFDSVREPGSFFLWNMDGTPNLSTDDGVHMSPVTSPLGAIELRASIEGVSVTA